MPGYDCRWAPSEHALTPEFGQRARAYLQGRTFVFCLSVCLSVFQIHYSNNHPKVEAIIEQKEVE